MLAALMFVCTGLGPDPATVTAGPAVRLPAGGDGWDLVGAFRLAAPTGKEVIVRLYADDSDTRAEKLMAAGKPAGMMYPNSFALHALYWTGANRWQHREVYSAARVRFVRVRDRDGAVLELRPNFMVWIDQDRDLASQVKQAKEMNKPFAVRLVLKDGVPTIRQVAAELAGAPERDGGK